MEFTLLEATAITISIVIFSFLIALAVVNYASKA